MRAPHAFITALVLVCASAAHAQWDISSSSSSTTEYQDPAGRFSLRVPAIWASTSKEGSVVFKWGKSAVSVLPQSGAIDPKAMVQAAEARVKGIAAKYQALDASDQAIAGRPTRSCQFSAAGPSGEATRGRIVATTDGTNGLVFVLTSPPADFAASDAMLAAALNTTRFNSTSAAQPVTLPERTRIKVALLEGLTSDSAKTDAEVRYEVVDDVLGPNREILIERGATAYGTVLRAKHRGVFGKPGKLDISIEFTNAVDGTRVPLRSTEEMKARGKSNTGATAAVSLLVSPLGLLINGRDVSLKKGTEFTVFTDKDIVIDPTKRVAPVKR